MKNLSLTFFCVLLSAATQVFAQCEKDISTHPLNPVNNEFLQLANEWDGANGPYSVNSMLNSWSWFPPGNAVNFNLNLTNGWASDLPTSLNLTMNNPFFGAGSPTFIHAQANAYQDRDWKWEDGWELLWMNLGRYPDMTLSTALTPDSYWGENGIVNSPDPDNIPYFVLYNRYRGTIRVFANVWKTNLVPNSQEFMIELKFDDNAEFSNGLSGIMRHAGSYDTALDQPTSFGNHFSPRQAPINKVNWMVTDFQMGFDPCICLKEVNEDDQLGKLQLMFSAINTTNIEMTSRSIAVDEEITEAGLMDDFLNMSDINTGNYEPGQRIYTKMEDLYADYLDRLEKYREELDEQRSDFNFLKAFLSKVAPALTNTFVGGWTYDNVIPKLKEDSVMATKSDEEVKAELDEARKKYELNFNENNQFGTKALQSLTKGILGIGFDFLNIELFPKTPAPVKPTAPIATFTETVYKGTISDTSFTPGPQLYQPGGITYGNDSLGYFGYGKADLAFTSLPAYNKVLGLAALLETPRSVVYFEDEILETANSGPSDPCSDCPPVQIAYETVSKFQFRITDEFTIAINRSLDFDMEKTKTYVQIKVTLENDLSASESEEFYSIEKITEDFNIGGNILGDIETNLFLDNSSQLEDRQREVYHSEWILLEELNQADFSVNLKHELNLVNTYNYAYGALGCEYASCLPTGSLSFDVEKAKFQLSHIEMKIMHDCHFDQIGSGGEQVNNTQILTYRLYDEMDGINHIGDPAEFGSNQDAFSTYIPGLVLLGNEIITPDHPKTTAVIDNNIFVSAEEILIGGSFPIIQPGYYPHSLTIQAREQMHLIPGTQLSPAGIGSSAQTHLRIKKDFYDTPVFGYADNATVYNFCNNSNAYQANTASKALRARIDKEIEAHENAHHMEIAGKAFNKISLFPNPARDLLTLRSSHLDMTAITIHDLSGRPIKQETLQSNSRETQINLSGIAPGTYIVRVNCGDEVFSEKLVVTR